MSLGLADEAVGAMYLGDLRLPATEDRGVADSCDAEQSLAKSSEVTEPGTSLPAADSARGVDAIDSADAENCDQPSVNCDQGVGFKEATICRISSPANCICVSTPKLFHASGTDRQGCETPSSA